jgi:hypothetical protein
MLANLLIFLAASGITVKLLDFYMSDGQKKWLGDMVVRMWDWLDRAKRVPLLDLLRTRRSQRILATTIIVVIAALLLIPAIRSLLTARDPADLEPSLPELITWPGILAMWLCIGSTLWLGRKLIPMMLNGKTALQLLGRASLSFIICFVPMIALYMVAIPMMSKFEENDLILSVAIMLMAIGIGVAIVLLGFWLATASLVLFIYLGSILLYVVELTVRRIAEYPNGPLLAVGALLGLLGAAIKVF